MISMGSVPVLARCSRLFKQWPCLDTASITLHLRAVSWNDQLMLNGRPTSAENCASSSCRVAASGPDGVKTVRMKEVFVWVSS